MGARVQLRGAAAPLKARFEGRARASPKLKRGGSSATSTIAMAMPGGSGVRMARVVNQRAAMREGGVGREAVKGLPPLVHAAAASVVPSSEVGSRSRRSTVARSMGGNPSRGQPPKVDNSISDMGKSFQQFFSLGDEEEGAAGGRPNPIQWYKLLKVTSRFVFLVFLIPGTVAQSVKAVLISPWLHVKYDDGKSIVLNHHHEDEVAHKLEEYERELRFHLLIEQHQKGLPPTPAKEYEKMLKDKAEQYTEDMKVDRLHAKANLMGTVVVAVMTITMVSLQFRNVRFLMGAIQDEFIKLDSATQAFFLLLVADIAVGYHSSDGWQALLACAAGHYGIDYEQCELGVRIFVATVPVCLDICFKWWVFMKLRKMSPSTQILLGDIERH